MSTLVVYESMFGNTDAVAHAVAAGLGGAPCVNVATKPSVGPEVDLLVVGGPTHAFSMSRASTRADAHRQSGKPDDPDEPGIREWIGGLGSISAGFAAFDTRVSKPRVPGSAAKKAAKALKGAGGRQAAEPMTFWVDGTPGPIHDGELDRAREWGATLTVTVR
ncbi:MAG: flavodoxin [Actinomycetota bacterium]|nr:flavodoxin [Actinomycetota bacterium]